MHNPSSERTLRRRLIVPVALLFATLAVALGVLLLPSQAGVAAAIPAQAPATCPPNWNMVNSPNPRTHHYVNAIDVISANDIWAVGEFYSDQHYTPDTGLAMHWDGATWTIAPTPPLGQRVELRGVSAIASNDVWAVGLYFPGGAYESIAMHWDGATWTIVPTPNMPGGTELDDVDAIASNDVWAVGANDGSHSTITMHWNGTQWSIVSSPNYGFDDNVLDSVDALSSNDVWAVGWVRGESGPPYHTITLHWNGTQWSAVASPNPGNYGQGLYGVSALSSSDVWAVGQYSTNYGETYIPLFLHWNGTQWSHVQGPDFPDYSVLEDVEAIAPDDIWAVGTNATGNFGPFDTLIMHWDGIAWSRVYSPNGFRDFSRLYGVAAVSSDDVWAVGNSDDYGYPYTSDTLVLHQLCPVQGSPTVTTTRTAVPPSSTATRTATAVSSGTASATIVPPSATVAASNTVVPTGTTAVTQTAQATATQTTTATSVPPTGTQVGSTATAGATSTPCAISFTDVPAGDTFYASIRCLACRGIVSGYSDGTFRPNVQVTRGQLAKIVSNSAGFSEAVSGQTFEDVPSSNTFYMWVERLTTRGYMTGYSCGGPGEPCLTGKPYFRPFANATRGQTAKIVSNAAGFNEAVTGQTFEDVPPSNTFYEFIQRLANRNVMGGYQCGGAGEPCLSGKPYFRPNNDVTRGQSAKIVANTFFPDCQTP